MISVTKVGQKRDATTLQPHTHKTPLQKQNDLHRMRIGSSLARNVFVEVFAVCVCVHVDRKLVASAQQFRKKRVITNEFPDHFICVK